VYPADMDLTRPFRTLDEQRHEPYASNLQTVCYTSRWSRDNDGHVQWQHPRHPWPSGLTECHVLKRNETAADVNGRGDGADNQYAYDVALIWNSEKDLAITADTPRTKLQIDLNVPHWAISFVERPYTSDMNLPNGFRHPITLGDHLIPDRWISQQE